MTYEISPSTLKMGLDKKFGCKKCFWLKIREGIRQPDMSGLGKLHHTIHGLLYDYLECDWIDLLPKGRIIGTEIQVRAKPFMGIQLYGYVDALIELESGGYMILDLKTTNKTEWVVKNYGLQVNVYRICLEHAFDGCPAFTPVERMSLLTFSPYRFGSNDAETSGVVGSLELHEVRRDDVIVREAIREAKALLEGDEIPASNERCEWCRYVALRREFLV